MTTEENKVIHLACEAVRLTNLRMAEMAISNGDGTNSEAPRIVEDTKEGSEIYLLISNNEWSKLFASSKWVSFLKAAQNFVVIIPELASPLAVISGFFPEETENILYPGVLF